MKLKLRYVAAAVAAVAAAAVLAVLLVVGATRAPARGKSSHHTDPRLLARPLPTWWNLTCPTLTEIDATRMADAATAEGPSLDEVVACVEGCVQQQYVLRSGQWVLFNYVPALERPRCLEAVTLTTHGDLTFLGSLGPLVRRWQAPVSLALYAPGDDFLPTLRAILWARACVEPPLVARHVSFHMLMDSRHMPELMAPAHNLSLVDGQETPNCSAEAAPWLQVSAADTYRHRLDLLYPINVARNAARDAARTHFVLASDMELLPSAGLSRAFLAMMRSQPALASDNGRRVFVLPAFEVGLGVQPPDNKTHLVAQLRAGLAAQFHEHRCKVCHWFPMPQRWVCWPRHTDGTLAVTAVTKLGWSQQGWEPFYIGTHREPHYDERLSWEGMNDKTVQMYILCLLDYEFHVLDDAFLVHEPGVKAAGGNLWRVEAMIKNEQLIRSAIVPEITKVYGRRQKCYL